MVQFTIGIVCSGIIIIMLGTILMIGPVGNIKQRYEARAELLRLVQQAGGQNIHVQDSPRFGNIGVLYFDVIYKDINGKYQTRKVARKISMWGWSLMDDFQWDKPLQMSKSSVQEVRLKSKEQIISEKAAEIKRLQEELARTKKKDK